MGTIITAFIIIYCIIVLFIMIEKRIDAMPRLQSKKLVNDEEEWINVCDNGHRLLNFTAGLSDTPTSQIPCRPIDE